jgi:integrase
MAVYKRGSTYWFKFKFNAQMVRMSAKTSNRRAAEQIEAAYKVKLAKGEVDLNVEKRSIPTFRQAVQDFLVWSELEHHVHPSTTRRYRTSSVALLKRFREIRVNKIVKEDVEQYKFWRMRQVSPITKRQISAVTVNRELACLKAIFNQILVPNIVAVNPVSKVSFLQEKGEAFTVLTPEEERLYLMAASQPLKDMAIVMLQTGMRPSEVLSLRKSQVNLEQNFVQIELGKTKAAVRRMPLSDKALLVLEKRMSKVNGDFLFPGGLREINPDEHVIQLNRAHCRARERAKLRKFRIYDLRHTFASRMAMAGVDIVTLAALLGHSRIQMVLRYAHPAEQHKTDAIRKLELHNELQAKAV